MPCVRVHLIDPSGDVLPYDHALAAALARRGLDVELVTSRFVHGPAPKADGYGVSESFYRLATRLGERSPRRRRAVKAAEHVPDMLRYRRRAGERGRAPLPVAAGRADRRPPAARRAPARADDAQRDPARGGGPAPGRADGRRDRAHPPRRRAARRRRARARDPARGVRPSHQAAPRGAAPARAGGRGAPRRPLLRRGQALQGRGRAGRGLPPGGGRRAVGRGAAARGVDRAPAPARAARARPLRGPLRAGCRAAGLLPARGPARAPSPQRGRVGRAVRGPRVRQGDGDERRSAASASSPRSTAPACSCRPDDPDELGAAIARLLADPEERRQLEQRALAAAAGPFSWDRIAEQTATLYEQVRR